MALAGKTIVFTGTLSTTRAEATKLAIIAGAKVTGVVSKSTNIIVAGPDATSTSKVLTAKAFGTLIWSDEDFKKAIAKGADKVKETGKSKMRGRPPPKTSTASAEPISEKDQHAFADLAKARKFEKVVSLIKEKPGYINVQPAGRWSALHQAAEAGDEKTVRFLVANGANLEAKTKDGKTAKDVAKASVKDLLRVPPKRKAEDSGDAGSAKRAAGGGSPTLHLFNPMSASDLAEEVGGWFAGDDEALCREDVQHKAIKDAPAAARSMYLQVSELPATGSVSFAEVAAKLQGALDKATLPAGESDCEGRVIVISHPSDSPKEACLKALAIVKEYWEQATIEDADFSNSEHFCLEGDDADDDDEDANKIKAATKVLAGLKDQFEFNFSEEVVTAPIIWGGYVDEGAGLPKSIVGVLCMRVWT